MMTCLKYLLPLSCILLLCVSLWQLLVPPAVLRFWKYPMAAICMLGILGMVWRIVSSRNPPPLTGMPGVWNMPGTPTYELTKKA
jgi:NADH-quinone oxidoreductase subunit H